MKQYIVPQVEEIRMRQNGVLCASGSPVPQKGKFIMVVPAEGDVIAE